MKMKNSRMKESLMQSIPNITLIKGKKDMGLKQSSDSADADKA